MHRHLLARVRRTAATVTLLAASLAATTATAQEERPSAMRLFPAETVLLVRTADAGLLMERLDQSATAEMLRDPDLSDLTGRLWGLASDSYTEYVRNFVDADLEDLLKLPRGEIAFGIVERTEAFPAFVLLADFRDQADVAQRIVDRLQGFLETETGSTVTTESFRSDEATVIRDGNDQNKTVAIVRRGNTFVLATEYALMQTVLDRWDGIPIEDPAAEEESDEEESDGKKKNEPAPYLQSLAENPSFSATLRELAPGNEEPPHALFYIDPIGTLRAFVGRQTGVRIAMATFPALGVDGIKAFGGAMWVATDRWDSLTRGHLLLANPRAGVVKVARLETGETAPPDFVFADVENYISARIDAQRLFNDIASLYDRFQYEGAFRKAVESGPSKSLGIDFEKAFIDNLSGSAYYITAYDETARIFGGQPIIALGVKDADAAREMLDTVTGKNPTRYEEQTFGTITYYAFLPGRLRDTPPEERPLSPTIGVIGDTLVYSQAESVFKQLIEAHDGTRPRLGESLPYRLVRSRLQRLTRGKPFSAFGYHDNEPVIRHFHKIATAEESAVNMDEIRRLPFFAKMYDTLEGVEWPPLETMLKYVTPSGSVMIDTDTGWHMISFTFRKSEG